jgi:SpoVK/Ycf46/Vps4 family AAA+-type ATPase
VKKSSALAFLAPEARAADVGGLEQLKTWLARRGKAFSADAQAFGLTLPKGVLLLGVQGCGKSLCCKTIAAEWNVPLLRLDLGAIYDSYVGGSEANVRTALATAEALAPCVLWIDEIEKGMAGLASSDASDSGTTSRVFSSILSWLQEKKAPVFVAATANRITGLPPELLRRGRFDEIFFVDLPNSQERLEILSIHLAHRRRDPARFALDAHVQATAGYSGAEIEQIVINALFDAFDAGEELRDAHLARATGDTVPLSRTMAEEIQKLQRWAFDRARPAGLRE